jgi:hypothetical protein
MPSPACRCPSATMTPAHCTLAEHIHRARGCHLAGYSGLATFHIGAARALQALLRGESI